MSLIFPVYCIADVPISVIERLLSDSLEGSNKLAPGSEPSLAIVTTANEVPTTASWPPLPPFTSPFLGQSVEEVSDQFAHITHFAVLDERSINDETATLVQRGSLGDVQTARVTFGSVQSVLIALDVATIGFSEIQSIAAFKGDVYGIDSGSPKKGQPAPRMRLGGGS
ncbi:hypothetical protein F4781DRAFT_155781 [Annulohypoxylon bovei var. microspora]|nr:hypothetical protein F4781DRAFT_155781 [Annulohypoxylon bovei var. microspora]